MNYFITFIQGMIFGIANIIPGFSGGTIAYMMGIYEKLLVAISDFIPNRNKKRLEYLLFLGFLGTGALIAIILFSGIIGYILDTPTLAGCFYFFIIGTIVASIYMVIMQEEDIRLSIGRVSLLIFTIIGLLFITNAFNLGDNSKEMLVTGEFLIFKLTEFDLGYSLWLVFLGMIIAGSMILPGFSGSALLVSFGEYENIVYYLNERMIIPLIFFAIGCGIGILVLSKVLTILLKKYRGMTTYFIIGLMIASMYILYDKMTGEMLAQYIGNVISLIVGFLLAYAITKMGKIKTKI